MLMLSMYNCYARVENVFLYRTLCQYLKIMVQFLLQQLEAALKKKEKNLETLHSLFVLRGLCKLFLFLSSFCGFVK